MTNLYLDRSNARKAVIFAVVAGFLAVSAYAGAGWLSSRLSGGSKSPDLSAAVLLPLLPWTAFDSNIRILLTVEGIVYLIIGAVIKDQLGSTLPGFLSQWLLFSLGLYRMERADYAEQTKPADPTKFPPGQI